LLAHGRSTLAAAGIETAALDARLLLQHATGLDHGALAAADRRSATPEEAAAFAALISARERRVPIAYLVGEKEFWGRAFAVAPAVLVPRPETEHLVAAALAQIDRGEGARVLDLGTGSGAILVSILAERAHAFGIGVDRSFEALAIARQNAARHNVDQRAAFLAGDWANAINGTFDIVVSNPPYLTSGEVDAAQGELHAEPRAALDGGGDGLAAYRAIVAALCDLLAPGGLALLELGAGQAGAVKSLCELRGLKKVEFESDFAGHARVLKASIGQ
jgi:release factor glutamine methyltransferase